jgi:drug/metabolite transporter (DMT)-like permease
MRPSVATFTLPALIAVTGSLFFSMLMIVTRLVRGTSDLSLVTGQMIGTLVLGAFLAPIGWVTPNARDFSLLALLGIVAMFAHLLVNRSLKLAPASVVVPYQYTFILWAIVFGYFVFGDVPGVPLYAGALIIVAAGIFIFRREQLRAVKNDAGIPPPAA